MVCSLDMSSCKLIRLDLFLAEKQETCTRLDHQHYIIDNGEDLETSPLSEEVHRQLVVAGGRRVIIPQ